LVRSSLKGILEIAGHEVMVAAHGRAGVDAFARGDFDLVLTDIFMPEMEGLEVVRRLRSIRRLTPILVMSGGPVIRDRNGGGASFDYLEAARAFGATELIRKPFSARQLLDMIARRL
jgi:CheY-like chemotaxis protein